MGGADQLRVSVVGGSRRVDLLLPAALSVADLLPELTRRLGGHDPLASDRVRLCVVGGPPLDPATGLGDQGVLDGDLLTVTAMADHTYPVDDDLATVVAEMAARQPAPGPGLLQQAALAFAVALLGLGAVGVVALRTSAVTFVSVLVVALLLAIAARVAIRDGPSGVVTASIWLAVCHAGAAAVAAFSGAVPVTLGVGAAWVVTGVVGATAIRRCGCNPVWAVPAAGSVLVVSALLAGLTRAPVPVVLTVALTLVVLSGDLMPWLAASLTGLVPPPLDADAVTVPDRATVAAGVRRAHDVLLVSTLATGLLLAAVGPIVAAQGPWGVSVAVLSCAVVTLRSRRHRVARTGPVGLFGGLTALVPLAAVVWWRSPDSQVWVVATSVATGLLVLAAVLRTPRPSARAGRLAELAEGLVLVALPPTLLAATGVLDLARRAVT